MVYSNETLKIDPKETHKCGKTIAMNNYFHDWNHKKRDISRRVKFIM